mmetsp:Transcript_3543/g.11886  ORF Transcript_3543/g.11886 Transcript_3543/m.11886 type:complete len:133 (-) Transcript_3543:1989-2387(-)
MNDDVRTVLTSSTHSSPSRGAWTTRRRPRARAQCSSSSPSRARWPSRRSARVRVSVCVVLQGALPRVDGVGRGFFVKESARTLIDGGGEDVRRECIWADVGDFSVVGCEVDDEDVVYGGGGGGARAGVRVAA